MTAKGSSEKLGRYVSGKYMCKDVVSAREKTPSGWSCSGIDVAHGYSPFSMLRVGIGDLVQLVREEWSSER